MIFFGVLPSIHFCERSSANTAAWMAVLRTRHGPVDECGNDDPDAKGD